MSGLRGREKRPPRPPSKSQSPDAVTSVNLEKYATLLLSGKAMNRVVSSPDFGGGTLSQVSESASLFGASDRASSRGSAAGDDYPTDLDHEDALQGLMDEQVDKLVDSTSRKQSAALVRFYNTLATHNLIRLVMTEQIPWRVESALDCLTRILAKARGARSGSALADGIRAAKAILFILVGFYKSQIRDAVSGTCLEGIAICCLSITPRVAKSGQNEKHLVSNGYLVWLSFLLLGLLLKYDLISDLLPEESLVAVFGEQDEYKTPPQWTIWYQLQCQRLLKKKELQLKQAQQQQSGEGSMPWTQEDTITMDGLCLSLAIYISAMPPSLCYARKSRTTSAFLWNFVERLAPLFDHSPVEFINTYVASLPAEVTKSKSSNILLGLPQLLGLMYENWWLGNSNLKAEEVEVYEYDDQLLKVMEIMSGKAGMENKNLTKNLTKEVQRIFRDVYGTMDGSGYLAPTVVNIRKNDVTCTQANLSAMNPLVEKLNGEVMQISGWNDTLVLKIAREFAGNHSTLAFAMYMEECGRTDIIRGFASEERADKVLRHAANKKSQKMERQNLAAIKEARNAAWEE